MHKHTHTPATPTSTTRPQHVAAARLTLARNATNPINCLLVPGGVLNTRWSPIHLHRTRDRVLLAFGADGRVEKGGPPGDHHVIDSAPVHAHRTHIPVRHQNGYYSPIRRVRQARLLTSAPRTHTHTRKKNCIRLFRLIIANRAGALRIPRGFAQFVH